VVICTAIVEGAAISRLLIEPLRPEHIEVLLPILRNQEVYRFITGAPPSEAEFREWLINAMAGPPSCRANERWLNLVVMDAASRSVIGRLEASVHDGLAEIALLFSPECWGKGFASEALHWMHQHIATECSVAEFWACTEPGNERCRRLLERSGYVEVVDRSAVPWLASASPDDVTYRHGNSVSGTAQKAPNQCQLAGLRRTTRAAGAQ
jgi:RimJ/RimL family protein N-acetyltransferase